MTRNIPFRDLKLVLLYPSDYFDPCNVHALFIDEAESFMNSGVDIYTLQEYVNVADKDQPKINFSLRKYGCSDVIIELPRGLAFLYRGFIVDPRSYTKIDNLLKSCGSYFLLRPEFYSHTTFMPNWYDKLVDPYSGFPPLTMKTTFIDGGDNDGQLRRSLNLNENNLMSLGKVFIKDWVKAAKPVDECAIYHNASLSNCLTAIDLLRKHNTQIYGGLSVRRFIEIEPFSFTRVFVFNSNQYILDNTLQPHRIVTSITGNNFYDHVASMLHGNPEYHHCCYDTAVDSNTKRRIVIDLESISTASLSYGWTVSKFTQIVSREYINGT